MISIVKKCTLYFLLSIFGSLAVSGKGFAYSIGSSFGTPDNHEYSVLQACQQIPDCSMSGVMEGVREPDVQDPIPWQMGFQRVFAKDDQLRSVSSKRARIQHIHANPLPLEQISYEKALQQNYPLLDFHQTIPGSWKNDIGQSSRNDIWARVSMGQLRNKMLAQTASWFCTGIVHPENEQKWRKFGNIGHMVGDSYSASHTFREESDPKHLLMSYSMDTVMWKQHVVGDVERNDFRFKSLEVELTELGKLYQQAIEKVNTIDNTNTDELLSVLHEAQNPFFDRLCSNVWYMDDTTYNRPAGGSSKKWSASSHQEMSILPSGWTLKENVEQYIALLKIDDPDYFYPSQTALDFCKDRTVLQCSWNDEIEPALQRNPSIETMFVPEVQRLGNEQ